MRGHNAWASRCGGSGSPADRPVNVTAEMQVSAPSKRRPSSAPIFISAAEQTVQCQCLPARKQCSRQQPCCRIWRASRYTGRVGPAPPRPQGRAARGLRAVPPAASPGAAGARPAAFFCGRPAARSCTACKAPALPEFPVARAAGSRKAGKAGRTAEGRENVPGGVAHGGAPVPRPRRPAVPAIPGRRA